MSQQPDSGAVKSYLLDLQARICQRLEALDGDADFSATPGRARRRWRH